MIRKTFCVAGTALCILVLGLGGGNITAEVSTEQQAGKSAYVFDQAIQSYLKGDSGKAIQQLNQALKIQPDNQRAKVFLLKILVERGSRLFLAKKYKKAYNYLSQAYHMDTDNQQVRQMFDIAAKQVRPQKAVTRVMLIPKEMEEKILKQEAENQTRRQGVAAVTMAEPAKRKEAARQKVQVADSSGAQVMPMYAEPAPMEAGVQGAGSSQVLMEEYARNVAAMTKLMVTFQKSQERQIAQFMAPLERIQNLYYKSEEDRKNFMSQLDNRFKSVLGDVSFQQRMVIYGFLFGLLLLGLVVWGFYLVIGRMRSKREETIMKYQQEMLKMVRDMAGLPGSSPYATLTGRASGAARLSPGISSPQLPSSPENISVAVPVDNQLMELEQLTMTGNYKERALAAVRMLELDADKALDIIKVMITDQDPFQRENMVFALGEQYHPLTLDLLVEAMKDNEKRVATAAGRSLRRMEKQPEDMLPTEAREQIRKALKNISSQAPGKKTRSKN